MQQVLFEVPGLGFPVYGFGAMLFVAAVVGTWWFTRRAPRAGLSGERAQDLAICLFVSGLVGARVLYMIQYRNQFPNPLQDPVGFVLSFFMIWKGGIIFYGSIAGGFLGYLLFYRKVLRPLRVSGWQLADAVAPVLALGLAVGRVGCYLNGCCWGQVCVAEAAPVPLGGAQFPLLPGHMRDQLVNTPHDFHPGLGLQTTTGLAVGNREPAAVAGVEPGSAAAVAGVKVGDVVSKLDGQPVGRDGLAEAVGNWPRGRHDLRLTVDRDGQEVELPAFAPRTVGLYPTQLYEVVSMVLLILFLLAYYPFRRHDGQLMTICMAGYAVHRFVNESLRIEPAVGLGLTLSQWGSVVILAAAVGLELYLWRALPSRWAAAGRAGEARPGPPPSPLAGEGRSAQPSG